MLSPFIDSNGVNNVLLQSLLEFDPEWHLIDSLLYDTANIVSEWTEVMAFVGHRSAEIKLINVFCSFQCIFCLF